MKRILSLRDMERRVKARRQEPPEPSRPKYPIPREIRAAIEDYGAGEGEMPEATRDHLTQTEVVEEAKEEEEIRRANPDVYPSSRASFAGFSQLVGGVILVGLALALLQYLMTHIP